MLPDYPKLKEKLLERLLRRTQAKAIPVPLQGLRPVSIHEGHRHRLVRADGTVTDEEFNEVTGTIRVDNSLLESLSMDEIVNKFDAMATEMESQESHHFYESINQAAEQVGNVVDGHGQPLSAEMLLEAYEKLQMDFNEDGTPDVMTMVVSPGVGPKAKAEMERLNTDPELAHRYDELIKRKKAEWRERENSRKLVG